MTDRIDPKAIADELRACVERGTYSGGGYKYVEVEPEDAIIAADTIDALVKERDELAAVIDTAKDDLDGAWVSADGTPLGEFLLEVHRALSAVPADVLREHDAALIESLADGVDLPGSTATGYYSSEQVAGYRDAERDIEAWLQERARQVREGGKP